MLIKNFQVKAQCAYCNDFFVLCPHKRNLESQLWNHLGETKHNKVVYVEENGKGSSSAFRIGKCGLLSISNGSPGAMQFNLHSWFSYVGFESQLGAYLTHDQKLFLFHMLGLVDDSL